MKRALLLLLLAALLGGALLFRARRQPPARSGLPEIVQLAAADAHALVYFDLQSLRTSPLVQQILAQAPSPAPDADYVEFVRATGFDYARDLDRVVIAARPDTSPLVVAEGRFDRERITAYALRSGRGVRQHGKDVFVATVGSPPRPAAVTFLDKNRIALAEGTDLSAVLDPGRVHAPEPDVYEHLQRVGGSAVFGVVRLPETQPAASLGSWRLQEFDELFRSIRWVSLAAQPRRDIIEVALDAECATAENARQLTGTIEGLRLLARTALADPKTRRTFHPLALAVTGSVLRQAQVTETDRVVRVSFQLEPEMFRPLMTAGEKEPTAPPRTPGRNRGKR
jgi:hypothetical protein